MSRVLIEKIEDADVVKIDYNTEKPYVKYYDGFIGASTGYAFRGNALLSPIEINEYFKVVDDFNGFIERNRSIDGRYSIVIEKEKVVFLATDILRSHPLFFSIENGALKITDRADLLVESLATEELDKFSVEEFKSVSFTSLNHTLHKDIHQLEAGQCIAVDKRTANIEKKIYYYHISNPASSYQDESEMGKVFQNVFNRVDRYTNGRPIVIPLSGGYDSRLIAAYLRKMNINNVICYTYGASNSPEVSVSKKVAAALGYEWMFVEYSKANVERFLQRDVLEDYFIYSGNFSSVPHSQDLLAVDYMTRKNLISNDSIFMPGHSGDLLGGSHIKVIYDKFKTGRFLNPESLIDVLFQHWYRFKEINETKYTSKEYIYKDRIRKYFSDLSVADVEIVPNLTDTWDIATRQAKFIVNSTRVYKYYGYDFMLPLWDKELSEHWLGLPIKARVEDNLYEFYLLQNVFNLFNIGFKKDNSGIKDKLVNLLRRLLPEVMIAGLRDYHTRSEKDPNNFSYFIDYMQGKLKLKCDMTLLSIDHVSAMYYLHLLYNKKVY